MIQVVKRCGQTTAKAWIRRTMKRELAVALLMFWAIITAKVFWITDVSLINALTGIYGIVTPTIFMFVTAAFGFDAYVKQIKQNGSD